MNPTDFYFCSTTKSNVLKHHHLLDEARFRGVVAKVTGMDEVGSVLQGGRTACFLHVRWGFDCHGCMHAVLWLHFECRSLLSWEASKMRLQCSQ